MTKVNGDFFAQISILMKKHVLMEVPVKRWQNIYVADTVKRHENFDQVTKYDVNENS